MFSHIFQVLKLAVSFHYSTKVSQARMVRQNQESIQREAEIDKNKNEIPIEIISALLAVNACALKMRKTKSIHKNKKKRKKLKKKTKTHINDCSDRILILILFSVYVC